MHTFCSSLMKFSSTKSVQTTFVAPQKPSIETFNNQNFIKVIISYENFIAIDPMKKIKSGARFSFSDFQGQKYSEQQEPGGKRLLRT